MRNLREYVHQKCKNKNNGKKSTTDRDKVMLDTKKVSVGKKDNCKRVRRWQPRKPPKVAKGVFSASFIVGGRVLRSFETSTEVATVLAWPVLVCDGPEVVGTVLTCFKCLLTSLIRAYLLKILVSASLNAMVYKRIAGRLFACNVL